MVELRHAALAIATLSLAACGGDGGEPSPAPAQTPAQTPAAPTVATPTVATPAPAAPRKASGAALEYPAVVGKFTEALCQDARALAFNAMGVSLDSSRAKGTWSALARSLEQAQPQIEALLRLAETKDCTFAPVALEQGSRKLPPELAAFYRDMRNGGAMLAADAARTFTAGDTAGAARRAAAVASMQRQLHASGLPMAETLTDDLYKRLEMIVLTMAAGVKGTKLADADRATIAAALDTLDAADPCGMAGGKAGDALAAKQAATLAAMKAALNSAARLDPS